MDSFLSVGAARRIAQVRYGVQVPRSTFYRLVQRGWIAGDKIHGRLVLDREEFHLWIKHQHGWHPKKKKAQK